MNRFSEQQVASDDEGEQVRDDELIGDAGPEPVRSHSSQRISQRLPRLSFNPGTANEGEILVGRYRVERAISHTPHEVVVEASHLDLGQRVLLRYLTPLASSSPDAVARFQRGARKAREIRSEHAERIVDYGRLESGCPYRAVELPRGPSLAEVLRVRGSLPVTEAVDIILSACEPIAEAHASGIMHRCLSPSNIFVERRSDGTPLVRVLDFGVSDPLEPDWLDSDQAPVPAVGTSPNLLRYASPEQIRQPGAVDARADVWALGVILYELLAGAPLFPGDGSLTLLAMIAADQPAPLNAWRADVPPELEQIVLACLEKDPAMRPRSVVEFVLALAPFASVDAQPAAARVARIVTRGTRPPPLASSQRFDRPSRTSALVRSSPPPPPRAPVEVPASGFDRRALNLLFAGAAIGLGAALVGAYVARTPTASEDARAVAAAPAPPAALPAAVAQPPVATSAAAAPLAAGPVAAATLPRAAKEQSRPARPRRVEEAPPAAAAPAPASVAKKSRADDVKEEGKTAARAPAPAPKSADDLFGGPD